MKLKYILLLLIFTSCIDGTKEKKESIKAKDASEAQNVVSAQHDIEDAKEAYEKAETISFDKIIAEIKTKATPFIDSTNFDTFSSEIFYTKQEVSSLKLEDIYPNFYKEGYNFKATDSYKIEMSGNFHTVVFTILKGENEMESVLVNYNFRGEILDSKVISYDEIAEGWSKIESRVERNTLTISNITWFDEKQIEISSFKIIGNGNIVPITKEEQLVGIAMEQLNLKFEQVNTDLLVIKTLPNNPNETIIVIPEYADIFDEHHFELNSHIVVANTITGKIKQKYYESSTTNGWESDAIELREIKIDTAPYTINETKRAFGIRVFFYGSSHANPYSNEILSLFIKSPDSLSKILNNYDVLDYGGEWDTDCDGEFFEEKKTLHISENKTNNYFDILVTNTNTDTKNYVDENGECDYKEVISTLKTTLQFNGEEYIEENQL